MSLEVSFINVGYGDAILIQSQGFTLLLDGGSAMPAEYDGFPYRIRAAEYLRRTGVRQIDLLIISHIHEDHVCGLEAVLTEIPVKELRIPYDPVIFEEARSFTPADAAPRSARLFAAALGAMTRILAYARRQGIKVSALAAGDTVPLPCDMAFSVLAPLPAARQSFEELLREAFVAQDPTDALVALDRAANGSSLLLKVSAGKTTLLLAADNCPGKWPHGSFFSLENVNVLKLPHHGQRDSISEEIMQKMQLTHVITTASSDRRYNSANPAVYDTLLLQHPKVQLLFTDERSYPPYFENPAGAYAVKLVIDSEKIHTEFINRKAFQKG